MATVQLEVKDVTFPPLWQFMKDNGIDYAPILMDGWHIWGINYPSYTFCGEVVDLTNMINLFFHPLDVLGIQK